MEKQWKQWETLFGGGASKITANGNHSHEIKRYLLLGRKIMTNLDSILKSRDITLAKKVCLVKAMFVPVVMYGCEGWTIKKAECWKTSFWTVELEKTIESPWDCKDININLIIEKASKKENQSWIFIGRTDVEAEAPIFWPSDVNNWLIGKDPDAGHIEGSRRRGWQRMRWLDGISWWMWVWASSGSRWWTGKPGML